MTNIASSQQLRSGVLSTKDVESLLSRFSEIESDIDAFSRSLADLQASRRRLHGSSIRAGISVVPDGRRTTEQTYVVIDRESFGWAASPPVMSFLHPVLVFMLVGTAMALVFKRMHLRKPRHHLTAAAAPTERRSSPLGGAMDKYSKLSCDVAFLGHPGVVLSTFARWLPEERPLERWQASWWMVPAWPLILMLGVWFTFIAPYFSGPFLVADEFELEGVTNQVWLSRAFGYQYMIKAMRRRIARGIEASVREADRAGVSVLGLGALNKAEFINRGGEDVLRSFTPRKTRLVHGNTLTAAVVVENVKTAAAMDPAAAAAAAGSPAPGVAARGATDAGARPGYPSSSSPSPSHCTTQAPCVFLTGATSKVGRAVALRLGLDGFHVVCCTASDERFASLQQELATLQEQKRAQQQQHHQHLSDEAAAAGSVVGKLSRARRVDEGVHHRLWVVGKFDPSVRAHIPLKASAVVFAVPCPLEGHRPDVLTVTGGIMRMDVASCTPRRFHVLLPFDQLYACHAAAIVHHRMGWTHHEVGKVDVGQMAGTLRMARECGFSIPFSQRPSHATHSTAAARTTAETPGFLGGGNLSPSRAIGDNPNGAEGGAAWPWNHQRSGSTRNLELAPRYSDSGAEENGRSELFLPRPGLSGSAGGTRFGRRPGRTGRLPLRASTRGEGSYCDDLNGGAAGGSGSVSQSREQHHQQQVMQQEEREEQKGSETPSTARLTPSTSSSSSLSSSSNPTENEIARGFGVPLGGGPSDSDGGAVDRPTQQSFECTRREPPAYCRVVVVGAGASGLSAAACVRARGEDRVVVLERSDSVCGAWERQYEGLRITTRRAHCGLPGWPVPREGFCDTPGAVGTHLGNQPGDDMSAQSFVRYLRAYRSRFDLNVVTDAEVIGADRETSPWIQRQRRRRHRRWGRGEGGGYDEDNACGIRVRFRWRGESGISVIRCDHLVVATGKCSFPRMPSAVLQSLRGFSGEVLHSSRVTALAARATRGNICIIGMGNSACDLAVALLEHGAEKVHISTRSAPPIIMRQWGPLSLEWISRAVQYLPPRVNDQVLSMFAAAKWGRGWRAKVFPPGLEQTWSACSSRRIPSIDKGILVPALLSGKIVVHGPIDWASGSTLRFRQSETSGCFDTVILATGFDSCAHQAWLGSTLLAEGGRDGVVHVVGFDNGRALLPLRQIGADARRVATQIAPRCHKTYRRPSESHAYTNGRMVEEGTLQSMLN